jgi:hypothetical protein
LRAEDGALTYIPLVAEKSSIAKLFEKYDLLTTEAVRCFFFNW